MIDKNTFTRALIPASSSFRICLPGTTLINLSYAMGSVSGRDTDKFRQFGIDAESSPLLQVPVLSTACSARLECRLIPKRHTEDAYDTCFGEVVGAAADPRIFKDGHWNFDEGNAESQTIHHLGGGQFMRPFQQGVPCIDRAPAARSSDDRTCPGGMPQMLTIMLCTQCGC